MADSLSSVRQYSVYWGLLEAEPPDSGMWNSESVAKWAWMMSDDLTIRYDTMEYINVHIKADE